MNDSFFKENPTKSFFLLKKKDQPEIGFTTGTCAAAASIAAARMLLSQELVSYVILTTPKGIKVCLEIENQSFSKEEASCSVKKFSGNDPDVTNGIQVFSTVKIVTDFQRPPSASASDSDRVIISGGEGVGRVSLPGLDQKVGEAAINSVPRKMIARGVKSEAEKAGFTGFLSVEISVPGGEEIAGQTFNPKLGIVGGISILGTSGIVEPMSEEALLATIQVEMNVRKAQGYKVLPLVPGNYGSDFLQETFDFSPERAVHSSNFIYDSVIKAVNTGFMKMLFCGHIGKLVKVAGGIKNTHSKYGDQRMEILSQISKDFIPEKDFPGVKKELMACISTEEAINIIDRFDSKSSVK
ncbi:MAG: cobalt-precorrin-5B (C(1))-methyltransferase CbiD, partial [Treponema sp.]|nr:cobalt-precorrin-5B (C(1))-methyltransferase CbiD [Treponema sp.]